MTRPTATIRINTTYTTYTIGQQYARNLEQAFGEAFPEWAVQVIPGAVDEVILPMEESAERFRTEIRVRALMTDALMQAVEDCKGDRP
jgi:hypothetical protein